MLRKHDNLRVIGIGSNHGVDQVGWIACEMLKKKMKSYPIDWQLCRTPTQLPELMKDCDAAVLIDAVISDKPVGNVISLTKNDLHFLSSPFSSHSIGVAQALQLTEALGQLPACYEVLGIAIVDPDMKPETIALTAMPQLEHKVNNLFNQMPL